MVHRTEHVLNFKGGIQQMKLEPLAPLASKEQQLRIKNSTP